MKIMLIDAPSVAGGKALALCDDAGVIIGAQIACTVECAVGTTPIATVQLRIDGETLSFEAFR